jgi:hypothetical protein
MNDTTEPTVSTKTPAERTKRFRKENRRIDYYPAPEAWSAISDFAKLNPAFSLREAIDCLVVQGARSSQ